MAAIRKFFRRRIFPLFNRTGSAWAVLALAVAVTFALWESSRLAFAANAEDRFLHRAGMQKIVLIEKMSDTIQVLQAGVGLFAASDRVSRDEWRRYVAALQLEKNVPGMLGAGFAQLVHGDQREAHEAAVRAEGFPNYKVIPRGTRETMTPIVFLEPMAGRNLRAFGYDMFSEPARRVAMERARDTGEAALTGRVVLVQEEGEKVQPGFLIYVPVYRKDLLTTSVEARREALVGYVYGPFRAADLLSRMFKDRATDGDVEVYDGAPVPENLLFASETTPREARFVTDLEVPIAGHSWTLRVRSSLEFERNVASRQPLLILIGGLALDLLFFTILYMNARHHELVDRSREHLEDANREMQLLARVTELLQSCESMEEAWPVLRSGVAGLFSCTSGRCYASNESGTLLVAVCEWGPSPPTEREFEPGACWAVRRGGLHDHQSPEGLNPPCGHLTPDESVSYLCVPLLAQGKTLGLLVVIPLHQDCDEPERDRRGRLIHSVAENLSLSLANLQLRESLRILSLRDPLTGLFNRRFMEETLSREISRATRTGKHLAVAMLDLDHFKALNDSLGHEAGDEVLRATAQLMNQFRQGMDTAFRYGGEELVLILPEISPVNAYHRLEWLRKSVAELQVRANGQSVDAVTTSVGFAVFPIDGADPAELLRAADAALYRAKGKGRNRVEMSESVARVVERDFEHQVGQERSRH